MKNTETKEKEKETMCRICKTKTSGASSVCYDCEDKYDECVSCGTDNIGWSEMRAAFKAGKDEVECARCRPKTELTEGQKSVINSIVPATASGAQTT